MLGCKIEGCDRRYAAHGYCHLHYNRWKRHGDPNKAHRMAPRDASIAERVALLTDQTGGPDACWPFTGGLHHGGYARVQIAGVTKGLHVWSLIDATGVDLSDELFALHSCDNRACANPRHLRWGTHEENTNDMVTRGRAARRTGEANATAKLTWEAVRDIRTHRDVSNAAMVGRYGVSESAVQLIRAGKRWMEEPANV